MDKYQAILNTEFWGFFGIFLIMIICAVCMIVFLFVVKPKIQNKKERIVTLAVIIIMVLGMIGIAIFGAKKAFSIKMDMDKKLFITYYGEYELFYERNSSYCYIYNGEERIMLSGLPNYKAGEYKGYVVYGKHSLVVVDIYE